MSQLGAGARHAPGSGDEGRHDAQGHHHGSRRARLPQLQRRLPGRPGDEGRGLHCRADSRHRRPEVSRLAGGAALPGWDSDRPRGRARRARAERGGRRGRPRLLRPLAPGGDAQGVGRARSGRRLQAPRAGRDDAAQLEARRRDLRRPDRQRQEPDEPPDRGAPARRRAQGGPRAASDAVRRPRADARAALRDAGRHRRLRPDRRGARGVRAPGRARDGDVRGRRLRRHPRAGPGRGRRDRLGRRQQRLPILPPRPADHGGRPAQGGPRAQVPPGRDEPAHGGRRRHQQGRQRRRPLDRARARGHRGGQPATRPWCAPSRR